MPDSTTQLMEPHALRFAAGFFLLFALAVGVVVYWLLSHPASRRAPFRSLRTWGRGRSAIAGLLLAGAIFAAFAATSLRGFHRVETVPGEVVLTYALPARTVVLGRSVVTAVLLEPGSRGRSRLVIDTRDGDRYESVPARSETIAALQTRIERGK